MLTQKWLKLCSHGTHQSYFARYYPLGTRLGQGHAWVNSPIKCYGVAWDKVFHIRQKAKVHHYLLNFSWGVLVLAVVRVSLIPIWATVPLSELIVKSLPSDDPNLLGGREGTPAIARSCQQEVSLHPTDEQKLCCLQPLRTRSTSWIKMPQHTKEFGLLQWWVQ